MATTFLESGTDATQDLSFWTSTAGASSSSTAASHTGPRSVLLFTSSPATTASVGKTGILADAGSRISVYFRFDTLPPSSVNTIQIRQSSTNVVYAIQLNNAGTLRFVPTGVTPVNGTKVLNVNTWYRISIGYTITNSTTFVFNAYINGVLENTMNSGTLTNVTSNQLFLLNSSTTGTNASMYFDDIYVDSLTTANDPGNIIVTNKRPVANGAANAFTTQIGSGGSGYGTGHAPQVNEQPLSVTNGWSIASASLLTEEYTIEASNVGDVNVSNPRYALVDYMGWIHAKRGATATDRNIVVNGSATAVTLTTTATTYLKAAGSTTYPSGNTAIGMNNNSVNNLVSFYECGILLAYKLPRRVSSTVG